MGFDFSSISGESFGNINDVFFKKDGKSIIPQASSEESYGKVSVDDIVKNVAETAALAKKNGNGAGGTVIRISKEVIDAEEDVEIYLSDLEERRKSYRSVRNKHFIDVNNGEEVQIVEHTEMYNGMNLYTVSSLLTQKMVTYPRSMFVGREKRFLPKEFYIREAERSIEDTIDKYNQYIFELIQDQDNISETSDGTFLEVVLEEPLEILGGLPVPDKVQIPVKRLFDLEYKLMMLNFVICLDNKIAGLLFVDIWF